MPRTGRDVARRAFAALAVAAVAPIALASGTAAAGAGARVSDRASSKYCAAFDDYDQIVARSYFAHGYEEEFGLSGIDVGDREAVMALLWSPRLASAASVMAAEGPKAARSAWRSAASAARDGVEVLAESVGLDDELIGLLEDVDPADADLRRFGKAAERSDLEVDDFQRDVVEAARDFEPRMRELGLADASRKAIDAIRTAGQDCGVIATPPTSIP